MSIYLVTGHLDGCYEHTAIIFASTNKAAAEDAANAYGRNIMELPENTLVTCPLRLPEVYECLGVNENSDPIKVLKPLRPLCTKCLCKLSEEDSSQCEECRRLPAINKNKSVDQKAFEQWMDNVQRTFPTGVFHEDCGGGNKLHTYAMEEEAYTFTRHSDYEGATAFAKLGVDDYGIHTWKQIGKRHFLYIMKRPDFATFSDNQVYDSDWIQSLKLSHLGADWKAFSAFHQAIVALFGLQYLGTSTQERGHLVVIFRLSPNNFVNLRIDVNSNFERDLWFRGGVYAPEGDPVSTDILKQRAAQFKRSFEILENKDNHIFLTTDDI